MKSIKNRKNFKKNIGCLAGVLLALTSFTPASHVYAAEVLQPGIYSITAQNGNGEILQATQETDTEHITVAEQHNDKALVRIDEKDGGLYSLAPVVDGKNNTNIANINKTTENAWKITKEADGRYRFHPAGNHAGIEDEHLTSSFLLRLYAWDVSLATADFCDIDLTVHFDKSSYTYTGHRIQPTVKVINGDTTLSEGTDYNLSYQDNIEAGTAYAVITGIGNYHGTQRFPFTIKKASLAETTGGLDKSYFEYNGEQHSPDADLSYNGRELTEGVDYEIVSEGRTDVGDTSVVIKGLGDFTDEITLPLSVGETARTITDGMYAHISLAETSEAMTSGGITDKSPIALVSNEDSQNAVFGIEKHENGWLLTDLATGLCLTGYEDAEPDFCVRNGDPAQVWTFAEENGMFLFTNVATQKALTVNNCSAFKVKTATNPDIGYTGRKYLRSLFNEDYIVMQESMCGSGILFAHCGDDYYRLMTDDGLCMTVGEDGYIGFAAWEAKDTQKWMIEENDGYVLLSSAAGGYLTTPHALMADKEGLHFTAEEFLAEVRGVYLMAHTNGFRYGDSNSLVPSEDGLISCDRLISRALYNLGYTDQKSGGEVTQGLTSYLPAHGFEIITNIDDIQAGDIVHMAKLDGTAGHCFVVASYDPATGICTKYDMGSNERIRSQQPFTSLLDEWPNYDFSAAYRNPYMSRDMEHLRVVKEALSEEQRWIFADMQSVADN